MKKIDQFILKAFIGPFFGILLVVVFILMLQFLWLYIDELVGKGLGLKIIIEFLAWGSATLLPLALPLATLLASVMTIGQLAENNELIAIKAAGVSLSRILAPVTCVALVISVIAYFSANNLVPVAYNKIYTLRDDIGKTKEEIKIPTGTFYDGIDGYILRVDDRNEETGMMYGVTVYDHTSQKGNVAVTLADSATMKMSKAKDYLTFKLHSGINYQETNKMMYRDTTLQLQKISFETQQLIIPLENYAFRKSSDARYGDQVKSMNFSKLSHGKDSLDRQMDSTKRIEMNELRVRRTLKFNNQLDTAVHFASVTPMDYSDKDKWSSKYAQERAYERAIANAREMDETMTNYSNEVYQYLWTLRRTNVELLKKFAGALACLLLFFIGAPLGAFIRRGGLGISLIIAVLFFVLYWVVDITGTKLARDGAASAAIGVFASAFVLAPIGLYLTKKAIDDAQLFNFDNFKTWRRRVRSKLKNMFSKTRIVFMGTPEFAVASLDALVKSGYKVVGCVTVADKQSGRGLKVNESAVKKYAVEHNIPVLQPLKLKDPEFLKALAAWKADLFVVVAFRMLPQEVWSMPKLGTINLHAALLPQYRGAAPINWAVINGERVTGVTTFMIDEKIDTGGIILRQECIVSDTDTAGDVHDKLMVIGADLLKETVQGMIEGNVETRVQRSFIQGSEVLKPAPKLTKELCHIDWDDTTRNVYNLIRGLSPYPAAYTEVYPEAECAEKALQMKIYGSMKIEGADFEALKQSRGVASAVPGTILSDGKSVLAVATADGAIGITDLQLAGKKRMDVRSFLLGFRSPMSFRTTAGTSKANKPL